MNEISRVQTILRRDPEYLIGLSVRQKHRLLYDWPFWARPKQIPPEGYSTWVNLSGRGSGKTRSGSEEIKRAVYSGVKRIGLLGRTPTDSYDVMVDGPSGIMSVFPPEHKPVKKAGGHILFHTGAIARVHSSETPEGTRGPAYEIMWIDELGSFRTRDAYDNIMFTMRESSDPKVIITTTPRSNELVKEVVAECDPDTGVSGSYLTVGSTYENAINLPKKYIERIKAKYEGTRLGRQEIHAELLLDVEGALWTRDMFQYVLTVPDLSRIVIGVDPSVSKDGSGARCGIVVAGLDSGRMPGILEDSTTRGGPKHWAATVAAAYENWQADVVVAEENQGGAMVEEVLKAEYPDMPVRLVRARRSKTLRAEPIALKYEKGEVWHYQSERDPKNLDALEDQMVTYVPGNDSPDRLDAAVYALTELSSEERVGGYFA